MHTRTATAGILAALALTLAALLAVTGCTVTTGEPEQPAPTPTATATTAHLPADCRDWIESELQDDTESVDAVPGAEACGHLSDAEMDQAIEDVTDDLIEQGATPGS